MFFKFIHWFEFVLGITLIAEPLSEESLWLAIATGAVGGLLTLFGIDGVVRDLLEEYLNDSRGS